MTGKSKVVTIHNYPIRAEISRQQMIVSQHLLIIFTLSNRYNTRKFMYEKHGA